MWSSNKVEPVTSTVWPSTTKVPAAVLTWATAPATSPLKVTWVAVPVLPSAFIAPFTVTTWPTSSCDSLPTWSSTLICALLVVYSTPLTKMLPKPVTGP